MKNEFLRHTLATIDYRFQKSVKNANSGFGVFNLGKGSRSPTEILNHINHVLSFTIDIILESKKPPALPKQLEFNLEVERFNETVKNLNQLLSKEELNLQFAKKIIQGPFSDVLTHIGQISMLSRLHGNPIQGEDFSVAKIDFE